MARLDFQAIVTGTVNGAEVFVRGFGCIDEGLGFTDGTYDIRELPYFYAPGLLTACILTGYPNATASKAGQDNPFQGRSYEYQRALRFGSGEVLTYRAECSLAGNTLLSHFHLDGDVPVVQLPQRFSQEIEESWETDQVCRLRGRFDAKWDDGRGHHIVATATSDYQFNLAQSVAVLRRLRLEAACSGDKFRLLQTSSLT
jgi:hypothetical protein